MTEGTRRGRRMSGCTLKGGSRVREGDGFWWEFGGWSRVSNADLCGEVLGIVYTIFSTERSPKLFVLL